jgi:Transposase DDE domain group 1
MPSSPMSYALAMLSGEYQRFGTLACLVAYDVHRASVSGRCAAPRSLYLLMARVLVSQAGTLLLAKTLRASGLSRGLEAGLARWRSPRAVHDRGKILTDLVVALALGGDCLADVAALRTQPEPAGPVASGPVISRLISTWLGTRPRRCGRSAKPAPAPANGPGRWPGNGHRVQAAR